MNIVWFTAAKSFGKSITIAAVRRGGMDRGLLKPVVTFSASGNGAEVVDLCLRKPYWVSAWLRWIVRNGRIKCPCTLMAGHRSKIGRYETPRGEVCKHWGSIKY